MCKYEKRKILRPFFCHLFSRWIAVIVGYVTVSCLLSASYLEISLIRQSVILLVYIKMKF